MQFFDFASLATIVGCITAVILTLLDKTLGSRKRLREEELRRAHELADQQERRIAELTRQNEQLHEQLEWHFRLLEAQERALEQPSTNGDTGRLASARMPARG